MSRQPKGEDVLKQAKAALATARTAQELRSAQALILPLEFDCSRLFPIQDRMNLLRQRTLIKRFLDKSIATPIHDFRRLSIYAVAAR